MSAEDVLIEDIYPLSPIQLGVLFHTQYAPDSAVYFIQFRLDLRAKLDISCFAQACQQVVDRHTILRTSFLWKDLEKPLQIVQQQVALPFQTHDWRGVAPEEQRARLEAFLLADRAQGFELARAPLLRLALFRLGEDAYHFVWSYHYLLLDGWSVNLVLRELFGLYEALRRKRPIALPMPYPFANYMAWLQRQNLVSAEQFWRRVLAGFAAPTPIGVALPPPLNPSNGYAEQRLYLPAAAATALEALARRHGLTLSTVLQGAWALLLSRYSGERDVVFGMTVAGRSVPLAGIEAMVGLLVNTLPLRAQIEPQAELLPWLQALQARQVEAREYEHTPLIQIQNWSGVPRGTPLFESILVIQNLADVYQSRVSDGELAVLSIELMQQTNYPLTIAVFPGEQMMIRFSYDPDRFSAETIARMTRHLEQLLSGFIDNPNRTLDQFSILTAAEREQALVAWNATQGPIPHDLLHEPFAEKAAQQPEHPAVLSSRRTLTYAELSGYSIRLAHRLRRLGVLPNTLVAVVMEKGWEQVVAVLGVLQSGGAYLPVDPDLPQERRWYLLEHGQVQVVLTQQRISTGLSWPEQITCICVDDEEQLGDETAPLQPAQTLDDLAYVIYTSGSTGVPKGVAIEHGAAINTIVDINQRFAVTPGDRVLLLSSLSFDLSVYDIFGTLAAGATIVIPDADRERDPRHWAESIARHGVTIWNSVPTLLQLLVDYVRTETQQAIQSLRLAMLSGDWIPLQLPVQLRALIPNIEVVSLGGATEASIWSITYPIKDIDATWTSIPYGRPMKNQRFYVLDDRLEICPIGVAGLLYIGGIGLARGYWRDPDKTNAAFFKHPTINERLYSTGDYGRYMADGTIEFLGRKDQQVKIRGFRIELEEIETVLGRHPDVQAVVVAAQGKGADRRLVAYIISRTQAGAKETTWDAGMLRAYMAERLPSYMVPSLFVALEALPLTPNGKVDRKALPAPDAALPPSTAYQPPLTPTETTLATIWAAVLNHAPLGRHDNFFELGGDSILSLHIIAKAAQAGLHLTPRLLFQHPTIAELAALLQPAASVQTAPAPPAAPGPVPLTPMAGWLLEQQLSVPAHFNQAVLLASPTPLDVQRLQQALDALLDHHQALRLRLHPSHDHAAPASLEIAPSGSPATLELHHTSADPAARAAALSSVALQLHSTLDLPHGPLLRAALLSSTRGSSAALPDQLLLVIHHLAIDVVSWRILLDDLHHAYAAQMPPAVVPTPYRAWAEAIEQAAHSAALQHEVDYWRTSLAAPVQALPCDLYEGANSYGSARTYTVLLEVEQTAALLRQAPQAYRMQPTELLLAALLLALARQWGLSTLLLDLERHGRDEELPGGEEQDLSRTVGWLTALYPLRLTAPQERGLEATLKQVKEQVRAVPGRGRGYGILRYLAEVDRLPAAAAELSFNYIGQWDRGAEQEGEWRLERGAVGPGVSPHNQRAYLLEVIGRVVEGRLELGWTYSVARHRPETVQQLAQTYLEVLRELLAHCLSSHAGALTPADFPLLRLSQPELEQLFPSAQQARNVADLYPLTSMQEGLLFHTLYAGGSGVYVEQLSCPIASALDRQAFRSAWEQLLARHAVLRTSFRWEQHERPLQVVARQVELPLEEHDWRGVSEGEQAMRLAEWLARDRAAGFELTRAPLLRLALFRLGEQAYHFVWSYHHLLLDGWSLSLVLRELFALYEAVQQGKLAVLHPARPFAEYVGWLQRQELDEAERFWRRSLAGLAGPTASGVVRAEVAGGAGGSAEQAMRLAAESTAALERLARGNNLTLSTVLQGAWALLLARYSGETDVLFGVTVSGRSAPLTGIEAMVGLFMNTLPLRAQVEPQAELLPWLQALQAQQIEAREYEHTPLIQIQGWSGVPRSQPLFESILAIENYPVDAAIGEQGQVLAIPEVRLAEQTNYPLMLTVMLGEHLKLQLSYDSARVTAEAAGQLLRHYTHLLAAMAATPNARLHQLSLLSPEEQAQLLGWGDGPVAPYPRSAIHDLFALQATRTPHSIALVCGDQQLTYAELDARANQLAHHLRAYGVGPDVLVAITLERSVELIIGLLGVLKAGGAYLPLDPTYPAERLLLILEDAQVSVLITTTTDDRRPTTDPNDKVTRRQADKVTESSEEITPSPLHPFTLSGLSVVDGRWSVVDLGADWPTISRQPTTNPGRVVMAEHLAYMIYTSGSTGQPKGVAVTHRSVVNFLLSMRQQPGLVATDTLLAVTTFAFDIAALEVFLPLIVGARIVLARRSDAGDGARLAQLLTTHGVTVMQATPVTWRLLAAEWSGKPDLRILCGGEALDAALAAQLLTWGAPLWNMYGPTETTIWSTCQAVTTASAPISLGRPIANTQVYVLDRQGQPAPVEVAGELYIGGDGLARGYLRRPDLTAERFVPDPFNGAGARLYRTGDRVRWQADGALVYLGRADTQIKLRGFRIELSEIEAALGQYPGIREAVVSARVQAPGDKRLVAYLVPDGAAPDVGELRGYLAEWLPSYMVPSLFVALEALPLTPNGKVDRQALPAPDAVLSPSTAYQPPLTPTETTLATIWAAVLNHAPLGRHDNFFELGGDSILSLHIIAKAAQAGLHLTPRLLFQHPTIAELAALLQPAASVQAAPAPPAAPGPVPLTPMAGWLLEQQLSVPAHFNQAVLLASPTPLDVQRLQQALDALLDHHQALRLRLHPSHDHAAPASLEIAPSGSPATLELHHTSADPAARAAALSSVALQLHSTLDLPHGPLLRAALLSSARGSSATLPDQLLLVIHHLAIDVVSWRILLDDLHQAYAAQMPPAPVPTSYRAWAEAIEQAAHSAALQHEVDYWRTSLAAPVQALPCDLYEGANSYGSARTYTVLLEVEQTAALLRQAPQAYRMQPTELLLAALLLALARQWGLSTLLLDLERHGRDEELPGGEEQDLSRTVGWLTALYPLRLTAPQERGLEATLKQVKEQVRAVPGRGRGYGILRYLAEVDRLPAAAAELSFNYIGQWDRGAEQEGEWRLERGAVGPGVSPHNQRAYLLEVIGRVVEGRLELGWTYSVARHRPETVQQLAQTYLEVLRELIAHCLSSHAGALTPSDFPLLRLSQPELEQLFPSAQQARNVADLYPLTSMQEGLLFHTLYAGGSGVYVEQLSCPIASALDRQAFRSAWEQLLARHAVLRTSFRWEQHERPLQVVHRQVELPLEEHDWRGVSEGEQQQRLAEWLARDRAAGFELTRAPLLRLALFRLGEQAYHFVWSYHHLLLDGWSLSLVLRELFTLYEAVQQGKLAVLHPARPFGEYVGWLQRQELDEAERFWRRSLAGLAGPTASGVVRAEVAGGAGGSAEQAMRLAAESTAALERLARGNNLTLSTVLQGAWALLLARYSGETDVLFGLNVSGRSMSLPGIEAMVGLFMNTLPLRAQVEPQAELLPWLQALQAQQVEAREYEHTPLIQIQNWSGVPRSQPLFESILAIENYPVDAAIGAYVTTLGIAEVNLAEQSNYPITLVTIPGERLALRLRYDSERVTTEAAEQLLGHYAQVLVAMAADPSARLHQLSLLSPHERAQVLAWGAGPAASYPRDTIHDLFALQATRTPHSIALICGDERLTYAELNTRANQLAHHLQSFGVMPDMRVGLFVERSVEMVVGMLGILKAGGAYVPLDPSYPTERLAFMLEDSQVAVLVAQQRLVDKLPTSWALEVCIDSDWEMIAQQSAEKPAVALNDGNLAYIIYTSGSTGRPKGVLISHGNVVHSTHARITYYPDPATSFLLLVSFAFDSSVGGIFWTLLQGGTLILPPPDLERDPALLVGAIEEHHISHFICLPSLYALMLAQAEPHQLASLRAAIMAGEPCPCELVARHVALLPQTALYNEYGPTEGTVWCSVYDCRSHDRQQIVPIGPPIANTQIYIQDRYLQLSPVGVAGELYIGGVQLARGYHGRPELTAERFVPNPFATTDDRRPTTDNGTDLGGGRWSVVGGRLYRTGDLARWLPDGTIEFLGRIDHQVKIRGFRIELGEIEAVLRQYAGIREVVVIARAQASGDKRMVAYLVPEGQAPSVGELRGYLKDRLPEYMIPALFVALEALPLTPNGKVDRQALPAPDVVLSPSTAHEPPLNQIETTLAAIWASVLNHSLVGRHDNFFEIGGDSIFCMQVVAKAGQAGLRISPQQMFQNPTIAMLAAVAGSVTEAGATLASLVGPGPVPITPMVQWLLAQQLPVPAHFNQAVLLASPTPLDPARLQQALDTLLNHHDALRLRLLPVPLTAGAAPWRLEIAPSGNPAALELHHTSADPAARAAAISSCGSQLQASLDLQHGPLLRAALLSSARGSSAALPDQLLLVIHHLAIDVVSWRILLDDLQQAYAAQMPPAPVPTSYRAWAEAIEQAAHSAALQHEVDYWRTSLATPVVPLPCDLYEGANSYGSARTYTVLLEAEQTAALLRQAPQAYRMQPTELLLAALLLALARQWGLSTLLLDLERHGRDEELPGGEEQDLSRTVGWLTALYPLRLTAPQERGLEATLKQVKEQVRAVPGRGRGYGILRYLAEVDTLPPHAAQLSFNYLGQWDRGAEQGGEWRLERGAVGPSISPHNQRLYLLEVIGRVVEGRLELGWTYSAARHRPETVQQLARTYLEVLRELLAHCLAPDAGALTPSDFPDAGLSQEELDELVAKLEEL